jgi:hypothetical protein
MKGVANMADKSYKFSACQAKAHHLCMGGKYVRESDDMGSYESHVSCACVCHRQGELIARPKVQADLFSAGNMGLFASKRD